jgi:HEAT repeat protein
MKRHLSLLLLIALPLAATGCGTADDREPLSSGTFEKALAILQTQAHEGDPAARAQCMEALQVSHDPRALDTIEQGLHDQNWVVRFAAAMASGELKAARVRPVLNTMVTVDPDYSVRAGCIYALHRLGDNSHMTELAGMLTLVSSPPNPGDWQVRANTAMILGRLGETSAISLLQRYGAEDSDLRVRFEVTAALARLGDEAAQKVVASESVNKYAEDQFNAMSVCADLPESVGVSPLLLGMQDVPPKVPPELLSQAQYLTTCRQLIAARSLARMKYNSIRAAQLAIDNSSNADPHLRALAALALGDMLSSRQANAMDKLLVDPDESVRRAAASAVVNIYARAARPK